MSEDNDDIYPENLPDEPFEVSEESYGDGVAGEEELTAEESSVGRRPYTSADDVVRHHLRGMYQTWFLEYASYVIL